MPDDAGFCGDSFRRSRSRALRKPDLACVLRGWRDRANLHDSASRPRGETLNRCVLPPTIGTG